LNDHSKSISAQGQRHLQFIHGSSIVLGIKIINMSQVHLIKLVSVGDEKGVGKGHTYYSRKNRKSVERKIELKKYNPIAKKHTIYKEKKA